MERTSTAGVTSKNLVASFKTAGHASEDIVAARRLRSGDIELQTASARTKELLEKDLT